MLDNILSLKDKFDVFILDFFGVVWDGKNQIEGVTEHLSALHKEKKKVIFLSNSVRSSIEAEQIYAQRGFIKGVHYDEVVTSGDLAYDVFSSDNRKLKFYQFGHANKNLFANTKYQEVGNPEDADFIYIGEPQILENGIWKDVVNITPFEAELRKFYKLGLPLICANPDLRSPAGQYEDTVVRQGSVARFYEDLGGEVEYFGKPYPLIFDFALKNIDAPDNRIIMIGDTLETDILGGKSYGIKTALTMTGIAKENMEVEGFSSIGQYCGEVQIIPDYIIKTL